MGVPLGGFDIDVVAADYEDWTLLTRLAYDYEGDYYGVPLESLAEMTRYLLRFGADPDLTDVNGYTALRQAAKYQGEDEIFVDMLEAYVAAGHDINMTAHWEGETALFYRALYHDSETLKPMLNF